MTLKVMTTLERLLAFNGPRVRESLPSFPTLLCWIVMATVATIADRSLAQSSPTPPMSNAKARVSYKVAAGPVLTLIAPDSPIFLAELQANFPTITALPQFSQALPFLVIVKNETPKTVRAYEVWWEKAGATTGGPQTDNLLKASAMTTPLEIMASSGQNQSDRSIRPGEERLVSPWFSGRAKDAALLSAVPAGLSTISSSQRLRAYVDCAVYGDGSVFGSNKSRLLLRYMIARDAQHDEALTIVRKLRRTPNYPGLKAELNLRTAIGGSTSFMTQPSLHQYMTARSVAAQEFENIFARGGYGQVRYMAEHLISLMPPHGQFTALGGRYHVSQFSIDGKMVDPLD